MDAGNDRIERDLLVGTDSPDLSHTIVPRAFPRRWVELVHCEFRGIECELQARLAVAQGELGTLSLGDVLGVDDDSADGAVVFVPRLNLPTHPLDRSIQADERVLVAPIGLTLKTAAMDLLPALGDLRKDVVVILTDDVGFLYAEVGEPPFAYKEVVHLPIEDRDRGGNHLQHLAKPIRSTTHDRVVVSEPSRVNCPREEL